MDGGQPHVRSAPASCAPGTGILQSRLHASSFHRGFDAGQRRRGQNVCVELGEPGLAKGRRTVSEEGREEVRRERRAQVVEVGIEEVRAEIREEIDEEGCEESDEEGCEETGEEVCRSAPGQEEGNGEPQRAVEPAASQEARASLTR